MQTVHTNLSYRIMLHNGDMCTSCRKRSSEDCSTPTGSNCPASPRNPQSTQSHPCVRGKQKAQRRITVPRAVAGIFIHSQSSTQCFAVHASQLTASPCVSTPSHDHHCHQHHCHYYMFTILILNTVTITTVAVGANEMLARDREIWTNKGPFALSDVM